MTGPPAKDQPHPPLVPLRAVRIFLASPGDVCDERNLARRVVERLGAERAFRGRIHLQVIAWDRPGMQVAMDAGLTPQEAIARGLPRPSGCDIVIVVLWSRLGTPLPEGFKKPDGGPCRSGTEWEYLDALEAQRRHGQPAIWLFRRTQVPNPHFEDPEYEQKRAQWQAVKAFFEGLNDQDGAILGGVNDYDLPHEFEQGLERLLRDRLTEIVQDLSEPRADAPPQSDDGPETPPLFEGVPYIGLETFTPEHQPIFFGRGGETDRLIQVLSNPAARLVAVVGDSGSGKSSLVMAGLIPRLAAGALPGSQGWRHLRFRPAERGPDPFLALAYAIKEASETTGQRPEELAGRIRNDPQAFSTHAERLLGDTPPRARLLLVIDQFEELFTGVAATDTPVFLEFIRTLAQDPRLCVLITLRADFYAKAVDSPLEDLLRGAGSFPLAPPGERALAQMIEGPARLAGLELGPGLVEEILADLSKDPSAKGGLALMAFTLHELYESGKAGACLSLKVYASKAFGRVQGAIQRRAESALKAVGRVSDNTLGALFEELVEVDEHETATRRRAPKDELAQDKTTLRLVSQLVDARLLIAGVGAEGRPTVEVAHEAVLSAWPRLAQWIEANAAQLRTRRDLERAAKEWADPEGSGDLASGVRLKRYEAVMTPSPEAVQYLRACRKARRRRGWAYAASATVIALIVVFFGFMSHIGLPPGPAAQVLLMRTGIVEPPPTPEMEPIPGGSFQMGCVSRRDCGDSELPLRTVTVAPFAMGRYEVTFEEYEAFAQATGRSSPGDQGWGRGRWPVINVTWYDAVDYAQWLTLITGKRFRLPTEAEWEYAARAGTETVYWWGDDIGQDAKVWANCGGCGSEWDNKQTAPVGSFEPNGFGLYDTAGNVWEWVKDCWHDSYKGAPTDGHKAWGSEDGGDCGLRVLRGGSWAIFPRRLRSAYRFRNYPRSGSSAVGFRLAQDL